MMTFERIKNKPRVLRSLTGLSVKGFEKLGISFERAYDESLDETDRRRPAPRQRGRGGGRRASIARLADKLLFILFYFKMYPTQEVQGFLFGLSQPQANAWIQRLTPLLNQALGYEAQLPARQAADLEQVLAACPGLEFIIDGSERPIQRPKDAERQRQYYSGKKKRHTVKNLVISDKRTKRILGLSRTVEGKKHDKALADEENTRFPKGSQVWKDTGFQGYEPENTTTHQPKKKPRGGELTPAEKDQNRAISQERIGVEHAIGGAKVFRIVKDVYRNHKPGLEDTIMEIACGLHNFRIEHGFAA